MSTEYKKYYFIWERRDRIKYFSDDTIALAGRLLDMGNFEIIPKYTTPEKNEIKELEIVSNIGSLCDYTTTTQELIDKLKEGKTENIYSSTRRTFRIKPDRDMMCRNCKYEKCPKMAAAYIFYLDETGKLEEALEERKKFRESNECNPFFDFNLSANDGVKHVSKNCYNLAKKIVEENGIYIETRLNDKNKVVLHSRYSCQDLKLITLDRDVEKFDEKENLEYRYLRSTELDLKPCSNVTCGQDACILNVAAYIYYMKKIGKEYELENDRTYYTDNRVEIELKNAELKEEEKNRRKEKINSLTQEFEEYKISNLENLIDMIINSNQKSLHCTIEGDDAIAKEKIEKKVKETLEKFGKLRERKNIQIMSLQNFAASNAYESNSKSEETDINGIAYNTQMALRYTEIQERCLYILTNVKEFLIDYKNIIDKRRGADIQVKQYKHAIELLTKMMYNNYIIIDGTERDINELLALDPKLQFIYQNYRFKIEDVSIDEMYRLFIKMLKNELLNELVQNEEEYKAKFIEYVSLNGSFVPFSNREFSNYIAMYCNTKGKIVFPENMYKKESVDEALKNIIGLDSVKEKVKSFEKYMLFQVKSKSKGLKLKAANMHMIFTGNPGTGKTTIARIMAKMLFDLGLIRENKLIEVERKDLVGEYIGQTAPKTSEVIQKAMGGVLFVDEAYTLSAYTESKKDFGSEAIATLIKAMEDHKDDLVVIFAGYRNEMQEFLRVNPGIRSRIGYTFDFPDYSPEELAKIYNLKMVNSGFVLDESINKSLLKICKYFASKRDFGNGRFVDKLIQETIIKHSQREILDESLITEEDLPTIEELNNTNKTDSSDAEQMLNELIGLKELKEKIKEFKAYITFLNKAKNSNINIPNKNMNMIFAGNPGSGKTVVARIIAKMLFDLGVIHENKVIETEKKDFVGPHMGESAKKTSDILDSAMGGVLFIDEAYALADRTAASQEAIATLIKAMEDHKDDLVVIFAGYENEMRDFIDVNPGIASRIGYVFNFKDYEADELLQIFELKIKKANMILKEDAKEEALKIMKYFESVENIGNGRFVEKVVQETFLKHAMNNSDELEVIVKEDIPTIEQMTKSLIDGKYMIDVNNITEESLYRTAAHEIGHATLSYILYKETGIKKITINAEGTGTLGYVRYKPSKIKYTRSKKEILDEVMVLLAGMGAEQVFFGNFENGNSSDLRRATYFVEKMIRYNGMSDLGLAVVSEMTSEVAKIIYEEENKILAECLEKTIKIIEENKDKMQKAIDFLMKNKDITDEEFIREFNS